MKNSQRNHSPKKGVKSWERNGKDLINSYDDYEEQYQTRIQKIKKKTKNTRREE